MSVCIACRRPAQAEFAKNLAAMFEQEGVALDSASYRSAPPGLAHLVWRYGGAERPESLTPWLDWAFAPCLAAL